MFDKRQSNQPCCAISATRLSEPYPVGGGLIQEDFLVTGSTGVAADTATVAARGKVRGVKGAIATAISGGSITFKIGIDLGDLTTIVSVVHDTRS